METINHEYFVSLEVAKLLKQAGFDWACRKIHYKYPGDAGNWSLEDNYMNHHRILEVDYCLLAPTLDVAQRWLREVKGYNVLVSHNFELNTHGWWILQDNDMLYCNYETQFDTYEEAQEAGIKKILEIILEKGE